MSPAGLGHVRWIGGGTGAGKSTVAARLAAAYGLHLVSTDDAIAAHAADPGPDAPLLTAFLAMDRDERWLGRDPGAMLDTFPWYAGERFIRIVDDVRAVSREPVLVEGFRLLPRLVRPLLDEPWHAVWLTTTRELRQHAFEARAEADQFWRRTSDPVAALARLLERDALFDERVAREAEELGLAVVRVDGSRSEDELVRDVAGLLRLTRLDASP